MTRKIPPHSIGQGIVAKTATKTPENQSAIAIAYENSAGHKNMLQLIQLRWLAVFGQLSTILIVMFGFGIQLPLVKMLAVLICLIGFNIASHLRWHERVYVTNGELVFALLIDVFSLTAQLYFGGGTSNPFAFLYLLQVILSAVLLEAWSTWIIVVITSACLAGLSLFSEPLTLPPGENGGLSHLYVAGYIICFMLNAALLVFFITRIGRNLHARDVQLADLHQRAVEEDHIVRMGLLASGAAHELGTPLATLSVILGDWRRMPEFKKNPDLLEEISEMETQLQRCKSIVSGILLSAGEARGESALKTTINTFLNDLIQEFTATRTIVSFGFDNQIKEDIPIVFDTALKQMVCNVLDNALEASPEWLRMEAVRRDDSLIFTVVDHGPGFDPVILSRIGEPYQSTKGRPGSGLGLFFVVNVARKLGGHVSASNRKEGGAIVQLSLPLSAIML
ncbi:MAG: ATP-binding protein [Undibacterium umbellatum]|uniref:ATP-binding protein n=1 Tax=Undibacterium umbellatum TaxID=2762300 RepID=UPI003BB6D36C